MQIGLGISLTSLRGGGFSVASLFAGDEEGVWIDPSDLTTLFQDTAGTTPVTTAGQTVAQALDKSQGLALGDDLTGAPTTVTLGWTDNGDGTYTSDGTGDALLRYDGIGIEEGKTYVLSISSTGGVVDVKLNGSAAFTLSSGDEVFIIGLALDGAQIVSVVDETTTVSDFSVREIPGNHATQATAAARPVYGFHPFGGIRNLLTYSEQFDNAAWAKITSAVSMVGDGWKVTPDVSNNTHRLDQVVLLTDGDVYTAAYRVKPDGYDGFAVQIGAGGVASNYALFDLTAGTASSFGTATASIQADTDGFFWCYCTMPAGATDRIVSAVWDGTTQSFAGDGTSGVIVSQTQLEAGSTATAYQRVGNQYDVTEAGVPSVFYLADVSSDSMPATVPDLGTDATLAFAEDTTTTILTGQTIGAGALETLRGDRTYAFIAIDRALTTAETSGVTAYLDARRGA